jgi:hypothetical protein
MLVKDLIKQLEQFNPEQKVIFSCGIESGRSISICRDGTVDVFEDEGVVVLHIDGEETDYQ